MKIFMHDIVWGTKDVIGIVTSSWRMKISRKFHVETFCVERTTTIWSSLLWQKSSGLNFSTIATWKFSMSNVWYMDMVVSSVTKSIWITYQIEFVRNLTLICRNIVENSTKFTSAGITMDRDDWLWRCWIFDTYLMTNIQKYISGLTNSLVKNIILQRRWNCINEQLKWLQPS